MFRRSRSVLAEVPGRRPGSRPGTLNQAELEAFSDLAAALAGAGVVLATGPAGSAVALGLAAAATVSGVRAVLVECDLAEPVLAETLGVPVRPGLHEHLRGEADPGEILRPLVPAGPAAAGAREHLTCVVAGSAAPQPERLLVSERCSEAIAMLRQAYVAVVLDGPSLAGEARALEALAGAADEVIVCGRRGELPRRPPLGGRFVVVN